MPPFLLANPEHWQRARHRLETGHWAAQAVPALTHALEPFRGRSFTWPTTPAGTPEAFTCAGCGGPLVFDLDYPHRHRCEFCDAVHTSDPERDAGWSARALLTWATAARNLALLGRVTGEAATLADATRMFNALVRHYRDIPPRVAQEDDRITDAPGRALALACDEAMFWWRLLWARDALAAEGRPAALDTDATMEAARLAASVVATPRLGVQHRQAWEMSCLLGLALLLGDGAQLTIAIEHLSSNMAYGFCDDGAWFERSLSHCQPSVLRALTPALVAVRVQGVAVPELDRARLGCRFLLDAAWADGTLPATNDGPTGVSLAVCAPMFHVAPALWPDGAELLNEFLRLVSDRSGPPLLALLHGQESAPLPEAGPRRTLHRPTAGFSFLRTPGAEAVIKYGPHGGRVHGHPDKLALAFRAPDVEAVDLGSLAIGHPVTEAWLRRTFSHNTVRVDGRDQEPTAGTLVDSGSWEPAVWGAWRCADCAPNTNVTRAVWLHPRGLLDILAVIAVEPVPADYWFHAHGPAVAYPSTPLAIDATGDLPAVLTDVRRLDDPANGIVWGNPNGTGLRAELAVPADTDCLIASAPGNPAPDRHGVLVLRAPAAQFSLFVVAFTWGANPAPPPRVVTEERLLGCSWPALGLHLWRFNWRSDDDWCGPPEGLTT